MKKKIFTLIAVIFTSILTTLPVFAYHWVLVGRGNYIDTDSIETTMPRDIYTGSVASEHFVFWSKLIADEKPILKSGDKYIWSTKTKMSIDCKTRLITKLAFYTYDAKGYAIDEIESTHDPLYINNPDAPIAELYDFICSHEFEKHSHENYWKDEN